MTPAQPDSHERHRAPALWLVVLGLLGATATAVLQDARTGAFVLVMTLVAAAVARLVGRGRHPEGIAVRSTWLDVLVLLGLAVSVAALSLSPGV